MFEQFYSNMIIILIQWCPHLRTTLGRQKKKACAYANCVLKRTFYIVKKILLLSHSIRQCGPWANMRCAYADTIVVPESKNVTKLLIKF